MQAFTGPVGVQPSAQGFLALGLAAKEMGWVLGQCTQVSFLYLRVPSGPLPT